MVCKVINQNGICVVTFTGHLSINKRDEIAACAKQVIEADSKSLVLYFKDVSSIDLPLHRELTLIQHEARKGQKTVRLVGLNPAMKTELIDKGVVRLNEVGQTLAEVITSLAKQT